MPDLIDREALSSQIDDAVQKYDPYDSCQNKIIQGIMKISELIDDAPTITQESLAKRGRWINYHWRNCTSCANCSECGAEAQHSEFRGVKMHYNYCPNCGAKMDLEES